MGRVRFYTENGEQYVTLRVEADGLYLLSDKIRLHGKREHMPPKRGAKQVATQESSAFAASYDVPELLKKILLVFDDLEQSLRHDEKGMVSLKPAYKKPGYQIGLNYLGEWSNFAGENLLQAILQYYEEVLAS